MGLIPNKEQRAAMEERGNKLIVRTKDMELEIDRQKARIAELEAKILLNGEHRKVLANEVLDRAADIERLRTALDVAQHAFVLIYSETCVSGTDYGHAHVAKLAQENAIGILAAFSGAPAAPTPCLECIAPILADWALGIDLRAKPFEDHDLKPRVAAPVPEPPAPTWPRCECGGVAVTNASDDVTRTCISCGKIVRAPQWDTKP